MSHLIIPAWFERNNCQRSTRGKVLQVLRGASFYYVLGRGGGFQTIIHISSHDFSSIFITWSSTQSRSNLRMPLWLAGLLSDQASAGCSKNGAGSSITDHLILAGLINPSNYCCLHEEMLFPLLSPLSLQELPVRNFPLLIITITISWNVIGA